MHVSTVGAGDTAVADIGMIAYAAVDLLTKPLQILTPTISATIGAVGSSTNASVSGVWGIVVYSFYFFFFYKSNVTSKIILF